MFRKPTLSEELKQRLFNAIKHDNAKFLRAYLTSDLADPNLAEVCNGATLLHRAVQGGSIACTQLLLEKGADPEKRGWHNASLLHYAASGGNLACLKLIIEEKQLVHNMDYLDDNHSTPLHWVIRYAWPYTDIGLNSPHILLVLEYLINQGCSPLIRDDKGSTPKQLYLSEAKKDEVDSKISTPVVLLFEQAEKNISLSDLTSENSHLKNHILRLETIIKKLRSEKANAHDTAKTNDSVRPQFF